MNSEKENETFGQKVTLSLLFCVLTLGVVTYTFNLFKPYMSCVVVQAPNEPFQAPIDP